jgi:hypothetical protein
MYKANQVSVTTADPSVPAIEVPYQVVEDKFPPVSAAIAQKEMQPQ